MTLSLLVLALLTAAAHPGAGAHVPHTHPCIDAQRLHRVTMLLEEGRGSEVEVELAALCEPQAPAARRALAALLLTQDEPSQALEVLPHPASPDDALLRCRALARLGQEQLAGRTLAEALPALSTPNPELYLLAAGYLPHQEAIEVLEQGLTRLGPIGALRRARAEHTAALGQLPLALSQLTEHPSDLLLRGDLLLRAGDTAGARATWARALQVLERGRLSQATEQLQADLRQRLEP